MSAKQEKKTLGLAITSLVFGCLFLIPFLGFLFSLAAIVLGIIALVSIAKHKKTMKGQGLAVAGIVLGSIGVIVIPIIAITTAIFVPTFLKSSEKAHMESAKLALRTIATAYETYYANNNTYPSSITEITKGDHPYLEYESLDFASKKYYLNCETKDPYNFICSATPIECGVTGTKIFKIDNSFEIYEENCK
jgi:Tfp pilus assembly protein PilE